jgi:cytochrome c-type biogenesis protein CcmH
MHAVVRDRLEAGETQEEIEAYFVSRYGEWILLQPQARGINLLVYGLPLLVLVLGFFLARNRLRKWARAGEDSVAADGPADLGAEDEQWLRDALRES